MNLIYDSLDLEECRRDLRRAFKPNRCCRSTFEHLTSAPLMEWASGSDTRALVIPGGSRRVIVNEFREVFPVLDWEKGSNLTYPVRKALIPMQLRTQARKFKLIPPNPSQIQWDFLWGLTLLNCVSIEEPLRGMIERKKSKLAKVFRALEEIRWQAVDQPHLIEERVEQFGYWLEGHSEVPKYLDSIDPLKETSEQLEALLFLVTLAKQHGLLESKLFIHIADIQYLQTAEAERLSDTLQAISKWAVLGSPLRLLLSWDGLGSLRKAISPKLARKLQGGLAWTK